MAPTDASRLPSRFTHALSEHTLRSLLAALQTHYLRHRRRISRAVYLTLFLALLHRVRGAIKEQQSAARTRDELRARRGGIGSGEVEEKDGEKAAAAAGHTAQDTSTPRRRKVELDRVFFTNLLRLLRICVPGWRSKEMRLLASHSVLLVLRTLISLRVAAMDGALVASLVRGRGRDFLWGVVTWMGIAVPATWCNAMLEYHQCKLALQYRTRLTQHLHKHYLSDMSFYALSALDDRIQNADQMITVDVAKFANSLAELYGDLSKPMLDMVLYSYSLSKSVGGEGLFFMSLLVQLSASVMRALTPPFGKYVAEEARLEGEFRFEHSRLIDYSEEVALYGGHEVEKDALDKGYFTLIKHVNLILRRRFTHGIMEDFVIKYLWGALGLILCSVPVFLRLPGALASTMSDRTESFVKNRRLLISASDAFGRIMFSYKEVTELAGYASRVASLLDVMDDIKGGRFEKTIVKDEKVDEVLELMKGRGEVVESREIEFINVPIITPAGTLLVRSLNFSMAPGQHVLVVGPNGCGKSSLFRILGGLWPVYGGTVRKPPLSQVFYVPQRPYLSSGSLRQQIIYPDSLRQMRAKSITDADLLGILQILDLAHLVDSYDTGWDAEAEWRDVLSGGLQQRVAMARLFYHRPQYAILDECTSSVTLEMEKVMYDEAKALGITLMTVSHRRSLWRYHGWILHFDGQGGYVYTRLDAERRLRLEDEREELEIKLRAVPELRRRMEELSAA